MTEFRLYIVERNLSQVKTRYEEVEDMSRQHHTGLNNILHNSCVDSESE